MPVDTDVNNGAAKLVRLAAQGSNGYLKQSAATSPSGVTMPTARPAVVVTLLVSLAVMSGCSEKSTADSPAAGPVPGTVAVTVADSGYEPVSVRGKQGQPLTLEFTRTSDSACGEKVVFPDLKIEKDLPLNQMVAVSFTPETTGTIGFQCGMNMMKGTIIVQ